MKKISDLKCFENVLDSYFITEEGKVFSDEKNIFLKSHDNGKGYDVVSLKLKNVRKWLKCYVHRLVAIAYIQNPENKPQVNHINEIKKDNRVENLEWATIIENVNHGTAIKRQVATRGTEVFVYNYKAELQGKFPSISEATKFILNFRDTTALKRKVNGYFFLDSNENVLEKINEINLKSKFKTLLLVDTVGNKKYIVDSNKTLKIFFKNKTNITDAITGDWLVQKRYKIKIFDYSTLKDSPNLEEFKL